ncbi:hypothetical protein GCM10009527_050840 [Actinomadura nitritigenes]|uniref:Uncharacterized protein n=1 Tax=Actinomadura nitritigenes TaxID=134602 RepID=A0ABS3R4P3_9ACTN|nr:hypothetical protein [Actinomadura nitritigenes]MBO2441213.1 hypothetical protein [Actinomadura nitritigenes]
MEWESEPVSWRVRRWAAPAALAVLVAAAIVGVGASVGGEPPRAAGRFEYRTPRFMLGPGRQGPWLEVRTTPRTGAPGRVVDAVRPPAAAGAVQEILAGPDGEFVVAASRSDPCETRLFRFRLTGGGHVTGLAPVRGGTIPALVAGLAMNRRGDRLAYATAPCAPEPPDSPAPADPPRAVAPANPPRAALTVLDTATGNRRTWSAAGPSVVGEIVWARDGRTLGYTIGDVVPGAVRDPAILNVTVRATDTRGGGSGLREGRVLFRAQGGVSSVTMSPDARSGYGMMRRPDATVLFSFTEGRPMHVTRTIPQQPGAVLGVALVSSGEPRYACLNGLDAFGRALDGAVLTTFSGFGHCDSAMAY